MRRRGNKYGVSPKADRTVDGILFASKAEMKRFLNLKLLERAGEIAELKRQVPFELVLPNGVAVKTPSGKTVRYVADFSYRMMPEGKIVTEDTKGFFTPESRLKIAVVEALYGIQIIIIR